MRCSFSISRSLLLEVLDAACSTRAATSNSGARRRSAARPSSSSSLRRYVERARAGDRLDAADALRDAGLGGDLEEADVAGAAHVRAAAELDRLAPMRTTRTRVAVLLAEQRHRAQLLAPRRSGQSPAMSGRRSCGISALTRSSTRRFSSSVMRREVREVEAQAVGRRPASPSARRASPSTWLQRPVQEVRRGVVARGSRRAARRRR